VSLASWTRLAGHSHTLSEPLSETRSPRGLGALDWSAMMYLPPRETKLRVEWARSTTSTMSRPTRSTPVDRPSHASSGTHTAASSTPDWVAYIWSASELCGRRLQCGDTSRYGGTSNVGSGRGAADGCGRLRGDGARSRGVRVHPPVASKHPAALRVRRHRGTSDRHTRRRRVVPADQDTKIRPQMVTGIRTAGFAGWVPPAITWLP